MGSKEPDYSILIKKKKKLYGFTLKWNNNFVSCIKKRNLTSRQKKVWINLASPFTDENKFCDIFVSVFELSPNVITRRRGIFNSR